MAPASPATMCAASIRVSKELNESFTPCPIPPMVAPKCKPSEWVRSRGITPPKCKPLEWARGVTPNECGSWSFIGRSLRWLSNGTRAIQRSETRLRPVVPNYWPGAPIVWHKTASAGGTSNLYARKRCARVAAVLRVWCEPQRLLALVKPLSPPNDLSGQLICGPIEAQLSFVLGKVQINVFKDGRC